MNIRLEGIDGGYSAGKFYENKDGTLYCCSGGGNTHKNTKAVGILSWSTPDVYIVGGPMFLLRMKGCDKDEDRLKELAFEVMKDNMTIADFLGFMGKSREDGFRQGQESVRIDIKKALGIEVN